MPVEIRVPALGESIVDAVVGNWLKHEGDTVAQGEALVELETDKINVEVSAEQSGVLQKIEKREGDVVSMGDVLGLIGESATASAAQPAQPEPAAVSSSPTTFARTNSGPLTVDGYRPPSPLARRIAAEYNVDISQVRGNSPHGRVTRDDVINYLEQSKSGQLPTLTQAPAVTPAPAQTAPSPPTPAPTLLLAGDTAQREERVRLSRRRQTIASRLVEVQHSAAMLTTFNEVDMSAIMEVRQRRKESFKERHQVSLGFMSFFTRAVVGALKAFPRLNAEIQGNEMVLKHYYDIGIAVSTEEGLVVPVVREADRKSFAEIEREIADLARRARENKLGLADLQGGTFTITNGGVFGSLMSTPILNGPQVGILGMHAIQQRPVAVDGQVVIRPMMYVALSYDHRIVDGSEAVRFLVRVKGLAEDPESLLLEG
ncbi:MAG TPA: 2-oxoglutarate dehydrogenase complex dihydrolipoyllysine-residue succinyltransferase [Ktedonobacteraceae bacterium]|nr:2-oxoglutarate dehydrogenase complex dihydrolipoyllysine-residue succinyltransferase [Ktedonobacteraceae bacterium]